MDEKFEAQKRKTLETLTRMLDYLKLETKDLRGEEKNGRIAVKIASDDAGRIIGKNGQNLENLQYILNLVMFKGDRECPRIMLDIDEEGREHRPRAPRAEGESSERRERRPHGERREHRQDRPSEDELRRQALDAAKEVRRWGEPVALPEMNAHDRRVIHMTLQDEADLTTKSEGEGNFKKVVIRLKKGE